MPDESNPRKEGLVLVYVFRVAVHGSKRNVTSGVRVVGYITSWSGRKRYLRSFSDFLFYLLLKTIAHRMVSWMLWIGLHT